MADEPVALVTGGARGIGRATAIELARQGYDIAITDIEEKGLADAVRTIHGVGRRVLALPGDLADLAHAESAVHRAVAQWKRLDLLVSNAAWREVTSFSRLSPDSWERTLRICLTTPAFMARAAAEVMSRQGSGVIVNVSSMTSDRGSGANPAYTVAKAGLDALTYELATLYGSAGIRVVGVRPGAVDTDLSRDIAGGDSARRVRQWSEDAIPLGRWASAEEIAKTIVALAGPSATYVTGATLLVDGGWTHSHFPAHIRRLVRGE